MIKTSYFYTAFLACLLPLSAHADRKFEQTLHNETDDNLVITIEYQVGKLKNGNLRIENHNTPTSTAIAKRATDSIKYTYQNDDSFRGIVSADIKNVNTGISNKITYQSKEQFAKKSTHMTITKENNLYLLSQGKPKK